MGLFDQTPVTDATGKTTTAMTPAYVQQAQQTIAGQGASLAGADYQTYQGPRVAALTPDQLNAQQLTRNLASGTQPDPSQMQGSINYGLSQFDPNEVQKYMSPYTSGVVNEIQRLGNQNLTQNILPNVNSTFTGAGQFGSTRNGQFENQAIQNNTYNTLGQQSQALQNAENGALSQYTAWHNQAIPAAQQANTLATTNNSSLNQAGALQQAQDQQNLNTAYQDFQTQTAYPEQQLGWYANLMSGNAMNQPSSTSGTTQQQAFLPSGLQTAAATYGLLNGTVK